MSIWESMGIGKKKEEIIKPTGETVKEAVKAGGVTTEEDLKKEVETRMAKWTPRQKSALDFLVSKFSWNPEKLTPEKLDKVEKFAKHPTEFATSATYEDGKWKAPGYVEGYH